MTELDYTNITGDRKKFDKAIYFSIEEAIHELHKRKNDPILQEKIKTFFAGVGIPEPLKNEDCLVLFRQIATPNYETSRFLIIADGLGMKPLFFEYFDDKFTPTNSTKYYLGKLPFHEGYGKKGGAKIGFTTLFDFTANDGKLLSDIKSGEKKITEVHHLLLKKNYPFLKEKNFFEASQWLKSCGDSSASDYYKYFFALFIGQGILFENFMLQDKKELLFIEKVIVPSFNFMIEYFGVRPLIVALEPTEIEGEIFWHCHNSKTKEILKKIC